MISRWCTRSGAAAKRVMTRVTASSASLETRRKIWQRLSPERRLAALEAGYEEAWAAWAAADAERLTRLYHPDIVLDFRGFEGWPTASVYEGRTGAFRMVDDWAQAWTDMHLTTYNMTLVLRPPVERIFSHIAFSARGADSGIEVGTEFWQVADSGEGVATRLAQYTDRDTALDDFGLSAETIDRSLAAARQPRRSTAAKAS